MNARWMSVVVGMAMAVLSVGAGLADDSAHWAWMKGSTVINQAGNYGTIGVADANNVPGARYAASSWIDQDGKLWLFGGYGYDTSGTGYLSDLWQYDPDTGNWTWMKGPSVKGQPGAYGIQGTADGANTPGGRCGAVTWTGNDGNLWLFGGIGLDGTSTYGNLNDLWQYAPATGNWTWMKGSSAIAQGGTYGIQGVADAANTPGCRDYAMGWTDSSGKLWLFGGGGLDGSATDGDLNDLWRYDPDTNNWTWMKGSSTVDQHGTYGTQGTADAANVPGCRERAERWVDGNGRLWLFGGYGMDDAGSWGSLNDLWQYDPVSGNWTWMKGSSSRNGLATYGSLGVPDAANVPGSGYWQASGLSPSGKLLLFGGLRPDSTNNPGRLSDLWEYDPDTNFWTWRNGPSLGNQSGSYGVQGVPDAANYPGGRQAPMAWSGNDGKFWIFGGSGYDSVGGMDMLSDLWSYVPEEYTVTFQTDGTPGATLTGATIQTVVHATDCTSVTVVTPVGYVFAGWTGDYVGTDNPLTITNVTADMTITANFAMLQVAVGSVFEVDADDVDGLPNPGLFMLKPKVYAIYYDPVKDPGKDKPKKASMKVLDKIDKVIGLPTLACEWTKKIRLYDMKAFKAAQAGGIGAADWITTVNQHDLVMDLHLASKEAADQSVQAPVLAAPVIADIVDIVDGGFDAKGNALLVVAGQWFGTKAPKVWREYVDPKTLEAIKRQAMKVVKPTVDNTDFLDSKGKPACMDPATGESKVIVIVPADPKGALNGTVVLENGVGMAAFDISDP